MTEDTFFKVKLPRDASKALVYKQNKGGSFYQLTPEEVEAHWDEGERQMTEKIEAKGHDCWDFVVHSTFQRSGGGTQDAYDCSKCGDNLQVG